MRLQRAGQYRWNKDISVVNTHTKRTFIDIETGINLDSILRHTHLRAPAIEHSVNKPIPYQNLSR